jgi:regulator of sirC expression with transglutaminase-like and TPR domain
MMSQSQQQALVSLLQEGDEATVGLVKGQLIEAGEAQLPAYHQLLNLATGPARESLREVITHIQESKSLGDISRGLAKLRTLRQLEELCWDLARADHPGFDGGPYERRLDQWAGDLKKMITPEASAREKVACLARYLGEQQRLGGNREDYYHPRNAYLPWVMEFRCGLPISLTLVYMLVGMRLGISIEGIGAPGHFLARLEGVFFDPYYSGRILSDGEWELMASEIPERQRALLAKGCTPLQTMHRLLINMRNCYLKRKDTVRCARIDQYLAVLQR